MTKTYPARRLVPEHTSSFRTYIREIIRISKGQKVLTCGEIPATCRGLFCTDPTHADVCPHWYTATRIADGSWVPQR